MTPEQIRDYETPGIFGQRRRFRDAPEATRSMFDLMTTAEKVAFLRSGGFVTEDWCRHTADIDSAIIPLDDPRPRKYRAWALWLAMWLAMSLGFALGCVVCWYVGPGPH